MTQSNIDTIISVLIIPILPILTAYIISLIKKKTDEIENTTNNNKTNHYISIAEDAVVTTVNALSQTTVDIMKKNGNFDKAAQSEILEKAKNTTINTMGEAALSMLQNVYTDVDAWLENKIECAVKASKTNVVDNTPIHNITVNNSVPVSTVPVSIEAPVDSEAVETTPIITPAVPLGDVPLMVSPAVPDENVTPNSNSNINPV